MTNLFTNKSSNAQDLNVSQEDKALAREMARIEKVSEVVGKSFSLVFSEFRATLAMRLDHEVKLVEKNENYALAARNIDAQLGMRAFDFLDKFYTEVVDKGGQIGLLACQVTANLELEKIKLEHAQLEVRKQELDVQGQHLEFARYKNTKSDDL